MNMEKKKLRWINDNEPIFIEDTVRNYGHRTWENAVWSDITLALAVDMSSPGEKTTRRAAGERYVGFVLPEDLAGIQAAQDVGLRCSILAPKGFRMHREQGVELEGRAQFVSRFLESE